MKATHDASIAPRGVSDEMRASWASLAMPIRYEVARMCDEMRDGIAIEKDKICGRGKRDLSGYYGLELAERELHVAEEKGEKPGRLKELRERVELMRYARQADEAILQRVEDLRPFHELAEANGTTVAAYLREMTAVEDHLRRDPLGAFMAIGDRVGVDVLAMLMDVARQPEARH